MWHWDQGHLPYFQFEVLRKMSVFALAHDFRSTDRPKLLESTGLNFAAPEMYSPWRNYSRVLKLCLLVSELDSPRGRIAAPTPIAELLADAGAITSDEYFHFLARAFTEPSPALEEWTPNAEFRYPLLFSLKYLLSKRAVGHAPVSTLDEVISAYRNTGFTGNESDEEFIRIIGAAEKYGTGHPTPEWRQARESLRVVSQISYLHLNGAELIISLDPHDAQSVFQDLHPVGGRRAQDRESEIRRIAGFFREGATEDFYDYPNTVVNDVVLSGFSEGSKAKRTHLIIERNRDLLKAFFLARPTATCDVCLLNTQATYPWAQRVLDLHHLLPLSSGTRVESKGTTINDLVPVCPTCHRAVHRYYDGWLKTKGFRDFPNELHAREVYQSMKAEFRGAIHG